MTTLDHLESLAVAGDTSSFPSHAELIRTVLGGGGFATLTTTTASGHPYGSLVAYSVLTDGSPLVCISELAEHTRNARSSPRGGMFVAADVDESDDPMDAPRISIVGELSPVEPDPDSVAHHLDVHPRADLYVNWEDFGWWRLAIASVRYVGGFGLMDWVDGTAIAAATPDPVIPHAREAIVHMNNDHGDANLEIVRELVGVAAATEARVRDIDRHGMTFYAETPTGLLLARVRFPNGPLDDPGQVRAAVVALTRQASASRTNTK